MSFIANDAPRGSAGRFRVLAAGKSEIAASVHIRALILSRNRLRGSWCVDASGMRYNRVFAADDRREDLTKSLVENWSNGDWAWMFCREHPDYDRDYRRSRAWKARYLRHRSGATFVRLRRLCPHAGKYGLSFLPAPQIEPSSKTIPWRADVFQPTLFAGAQACCGKRCDPDFDLSAMTSGRAFVVIGPDGQMLHLRNGTREAAVANTGRSVLFGPVRMAFTIDVLAQFASASRAIRLLKSLMIGRQASATPRLSKTTIARRLRSVRAMHAIKQGGSLRDIARNIFGTDRVETEWSNPASRALKDETRRAKAKATSLMRGGYKKFFRS